MAINLEPGDEHSNDRNTGTDLSSLFRVLINEVQGLHKVQQDTKDLLSRTLNMKETFTTNKKTQSEAKDIRDRVNDTRPASPKRVEDSIDLGNSRVSPSGAAPKASANPLAGYSQKAREAFGNVSSPSFNQAVRNPGNVAQNFGSDLLSQLGNGVRSSVFQNWDKRDRANADRQKGYSVPSTHDDRNPVETRPSESINQADESSAPEGPRNQAQAQNNKRRGKKASTKSTSVFDNAMQNLRAQINSASDHTDATNGGNFPKNAIRRNEEEQNREASPPPPSQGKTWDYGAAGPGGPNGYTPGSKNGPYGPYGRYGTSSTTGGHGGGGGSYGDYGGGGGSGGGGSSGQNGSYGENTGVGGWIKKNIPGAGMLFGAADEAKSQRNKNAYYQNIEGGSNASKFAERGHEEAYAATAGGLGGVFSEAEAREAFKGVTRIGYNGVQGKDFSTQGGRQDALNFAYHGKSSYGADVSESLRQLEQASKDATINLTTLQTSLKGVSDAAGKAGVNSQMARQNMMNLMSAGQAQGMPGAAAQNMASNMAQGQASMGRDFENYNASGGMSQGVQYIQAANAGISRGSLLNMQSTDPVKAQKIAVGNQVQQASNQLPPDMVQYIQSELKNTKGTVDEPVARQLAQKVLKQPQWQQYNDTNFWQGYIATTGADPNATALQLLTTIILNIAGQNPDLKAAEKSTAAQPTNVTNGKDGPSKNLPNGVQSSDQGYADAKTYSKWQGQGKNSGDHAAVAALTGEEKTGGRSRVLEGILQNTPDSNKVQVEVHTQSGARVVSLADAIKNHPQELASGDVSFMSGANKGKTVNDVVGQGNTDPNADWSTEGQKKDDSGKSLKDYQKDNPADTGKGTGANGTVLIDLTTAAKQLLQVTSTTGNAATTNAAGTGAPVQNPYPDNPTRNSNY